MFSLTYRVWRWLLPLAVLMLLWAWINFAAFVLLAIWRGVVVLSLLFWPSVGLAAIFWFLYPVLSFKITPAAAAEAEWVVSAVAEGIDEWKSWLVGPLRVLRWLGVWGGLVIALGLFLALPFADRMLRANAAEILTFALTRAGAVAAGYVLAASLGATLATGWAVVSRAWRGGVRFSDS